MRIQEQTDCHLSRLSRSLMTRTAFGRLLLMPTGHLALTRFIILLFLPQLPLPLPLACLFLLLSLSLASSFVPSSPPVSIVVTLARSISSSSRCALRSLRGSLDVGAARVATVKFDLLGLRTTFCRRRRCDGSVLYADSAVTY